MVPPAYMCGYVKELRVVVAAAAGVGLGKRSVERVKARQVGLEGFLRRGRGSGSGTGLDGEGKDCSLDNLRTFI